MSNVSVEHPRTGVALVTLDRPEKYNALSPGVLSAVPRVKVHSRSAFDAVLADVRARGSRS